LKAKRGDTVNVHYAGKLKNGRIFDTSKDRGMLKFTIGAGRLLERFEAAVIGMEPGETKIILIACEQGYGPRNDNLFLTIDRSKFLPETKLDVGMRVELGIESGLFTDALITEVAEGRVILDANHPLAGEDLIFGIQLVEIL